MVDLAMKAAKATADIKTAATAPGLRRDAIGLREVLFQSITGMAPGAPRAHPPAPGQGPRGVDRARRRPAEPRPPLPHRAQPAKLERELGWLPTVDFAAGLAAAAGPVPEGTGRQRGSVASRSWIASDRRPDFLAGHATATNVTAEEVAIESLYPADHGRGRATNGWSCRSDRWPDLGTALAQIAPEGSIELAARGMVKGAGHPAIHRCRCRHAVSRAQLVHAPGVRRVGERRLRRVS
jgi:hypothetical protein